MAVKSFLSGIFTGTTFLTGAAFLIGAFLAATFLAGDFFAGTFFVGAFFAATFFAEVAFFATAFLATFFATAFLAGFAAFTLFLSALNPATIVLWFFRTTFETFVSNCSKRWLYYTQGLADCGANCLRFNQKAIVSKVR
ncbi:unannotated protein [freshwater metagenome]|uniref:Unannotated protein n=1 Tax=freshwater metagenome TaxID=449393 RepID=A0A6J6FUT5_9ZZZZ